MNSTRIIATLMSKQNLKDDKMTAGLYLTIMITACVVTLVASLLYHTFCDTLKRAKIDLYADREKRTENGGITMDANMILWDALLKHRGHNVSIVSYGDIDNPVNVCLECEDCGEVILDAELYTICAREV